MISLMFRVMFGVAYAVWLFRFIQHPENLANGIWAIIFLVSYVWEDLSSKIEKLTKEK